MITVYYQYTTVSPVMTWGSPRAHSGEYVVWAADRLENFWALTGKRK